MARHTTEDSEAGPPPADARAAAEALRLRPLEQEALVAEAEPFARVLPDPTARARYLELAAAARQGVVPAHLVGLLEAMLELVLQTRRVRREQGPEAEQALIDLFFRTPRGQALSRAAHEVNQALRALEGQPLLSLAFSPIPGGHRLALKTAQCQLGLTIDRMGVRVDRLEVGA